MGVGRGSVCVCGGCASAFLFGDWVVVLAVLAVVNGVGAVVVGGWLIHTCTDAQNITQHFTKCVCVQTRRVKHRGKRTPRILGFAFDFRTAVQLVLCNTFNNASGQTTSQ